MSPALYQLSYLAICANGDIVYQKRRSSVNGSPRNSFLPVRDEIFVGGLEVSAAEETAIRRERRRMRAREDEVPRTVDKGRLLLRIGAPE